MRAHGLVVHPYMLVPSSFNLSLDSLSMEYHCTHHTSRILHNIRILLTCRSQARSRTVYK